MTLSEIDSLTARLEVLQSQDHTEAISLVRDAHVLVRKLFGDDSPHLTELAQITFRPQDKIYNTGHYMIAATWDGGCKGLKEILRSMHYELNLSLQQKTELKPPEKVTIPWLYHHLSWQVWLGFVGLLVAACGGGIALGRNNFFVKAMELFNNSAKP